MLRQSSGEYEEQHHERINLTQWRGVFQFSRNLAMVQGAGWTLLSAAATVGFCPRLPAELKKTRFTARFERAASTALSLEHPEAFLESAVQPAKTEPFCVWYRDGTRL